jgi:cytochrome c oxidase subunit 4
MASDDDSNTDAPDSETPSEKPAPSAEATDAADAKARAAADSADEDDEDEDEDEERAEAAAAAREVEAAAEHAPDHALPAHADDEHGHGLAHVTPLKLLVAVLVTLLVLTVITVAVTKVDLGGQWNLVVAMVIATVKAGLVVTYFMHLRWDKAFNVLVFLSSVLFLILFLSLALTDRKEYQRTIDLLEQTQQPTPAKVH